MNPTEYASSPVETSGRWTPEKAWTWYNSHPWPCGFNYLPASAISYTEMWMDYDFNPALIDKELALAESVGFNCARVVLPFVVWENEPERFKQRLEQFLEICARHKIRVMLCLFDDCVFGSITNPVFARQPDIIEGWYANGWTPSPGVKLVTDPQAWPRLEKYVKDITTTFKNDLRLWVWDLYNEPTNGNSGDISVALVEKVFEWAREIAPAQPLTVGEWNGNEPLNELIRRSTDIVTFHDYTAKASLETHIQQLKTQGRPVICTEWLNRTTESLVPDCLPIFRQENVGAIGWGLINGRTQTHLNWGHRPGDPAPPAWQHDLFHPNHTPYNLNEIELFKKVIRG